MFDSICNIKILIQTSSASEMEMYLRDEPLAPVSAKTASKEVIHISK